MKPNFEISPSLSTTNMNPPRSPNQQSISLYKSLTYDVDTFYQTIQSQYALLPKREVILAAVNNLVNAQESDRILSMFGSALSILNSDFNNNFEAINTILQGVMQCYGDRWIIAKSKDARLILTSLLVVLNYIVVLSGQLYSMSFAIAFSFFKDWSVLQEGPGSDDYRNLMQLLVLDNCYALSFGTDRSSMIYTMFDGKRCDEFLRSLERKDKVEFFEIGLLLLVISNDYTLNDPANSFEELTPTQQNHKFLQIIKSTNELSLFFARVLAQMSTSRPANVDKFIYENQHKAFKLCKKIYNMIDEQLDDFEFPQLQPLLSLIVMKCVHILKDLSTLVRSMIDMDELLHMNEAVPRFKALEEAMQNEFTRCLNVQLPNRLVRGTLITLASQPRPRGIQPAELGAKNAKDHWQVMETWCQQANEYFTWSLKNDFDHGWLS